jgi:ribosomal protein L44E
MEVNQGAQTSVTEWTEQDEQQLKELRRRKKAWQITQQGRKRKFGPKKYGNSPKFLKRFNCERCGKKLTKEEHEIDTGNLCEDCRKVTINEDEK